MNERHEAPGESSEENDKDDWGTGAPPLQGQAEEVKMKGTSSLSINT